MTYRDTYFGGASRDRALMAIGRLIYHDRETHNEYLAWVGLSDWEKRHYATRVVEKERERGR